MDLLKEYQAFCRKGILEATQEREPVVGFALGLTGEAGEVVDDIKKRIFHGREIPLEHTELELGDVLWYVANIASEYGFTLEDIIRKNMDKLLKRYPDKYCAKYQFSKSGPHIKMSDENGKFIKFVNKEEAKQYGYTVEDTGAGSSDVPWD